MAGATIGDDFAPIYELDFGSHTWEINGGADMSEVYDHATVDDILDVARADPDCTVRAIGFQ